MSRPNRHNERINDVVEDALLFACDTEEVLIKFRDLADALIARAREEKHKVSVNGERIGWTHGRPELLRRKVG